MLTLNDDSHKPKCQCNTCLASAKRDNVAGMNAAALAALPREFPAVRFANTRFGYERSEWRATRRNAGTLRGLEHLGKLTVLATDGVQAWYALPHGGNVMASVDPIALCANAKHETQRVMLAHIASFSGKVEPLYSAKAHSAPKREQAKKISPRQALLASL